MAAKLLWGSDLYKGFKLDKNTLLGGAIDDILPFQMLTMEEKTKDWIKAVADYYETAGWANVERKAGRIQRNYWMRYGKLNMSDYIVNPQFNEYYEAVGWILPPDSKSPLEQFYPLAPHFVDVLRGEFIKRDNTWTVEAVDPMSHAEALENKKQQFEQALLQQAMMEKQMTMARMGLTEDIDPQRYQQEMQAIQEHMTKIEFESRNFRTTGVKWAEKVLKIQEKRYRLYEIEPDGFESGLISDREFWHLDLMDDDFRLELLNPKWCDYHKGPNTKYVSNGDYFLWFDFMSAGDVVNRLGRRMTEEDILKMKDIYVKTFNIIVPDYLKSHQGSYYDLSKNWLQATDLDPKMNDALLGKELVYNFTRTPNFDHNMEVDILNPIWGRRITGHPQMFRVMRLYWRSMKKIGWLTKINRDGTRPLPEWIDENYKVTVEPEYDTSVNKDKTKDNLIYGEHIDWTWATEWRHIIKISPNQKHTFWLNSQNAFESIYIDGGPVKFQFKGKDNPFDALPPIEGCEFSYINTDAHGFIDRIRPIQILYNIAMNRVPKKILKDFGNKVAVDRRLIPQNNLSQSSPTIDPLEEYEDRLQNSDILDFTISRESLEGLGQPPLPHVLQLSTIQEAQLYFQLAQQLKLEAGELIGISRNRLGQNKPNETATGVTQGISYSETQTEKYYEQHANLMERVRQRMLDAAQYYTTFNESSRAMYINEKDENLFLDIDGMSNTLPQYNIFLQSRANVRNALQIIGQFLMKENTLEILPSAKISALVEQSVPKLMELIRKGEIEQAEREEASRQHEIQLEQERRQTEIDKLRAEQEFEASENAKDRQRDIEVTTIKALSQGKEEGKTTPDTRDDLDSYLAEQELRDKRQQATDALNTKRQTELDKLQVERERTSADIQKERIKGEYNLKVAKENKTEAELKRKGKKK